jgi:predicted TIM-barrel fold metal-dependent hydrolase
MIAIDVHVHPNDEAAARAIGARAAQMAQYFKQDMKTVSLDELADRYRAKDMMAVLLNTTDVATSGIAPVPNDHIAAAVARNPDVFIGFGVVEPSQGRAAVDEAKRCAEELGLRGLGELNPGRQHFYPDDPAFEALWTAASDLGLVVMFHGGLLGAGAGTPGGSGYKLKYARPIPHLDDVAADFPELKIIAAHPAWPWQEESLAVARHKSNVYIDLSGWAPKYFPESLVRYADTILKNRMLFGSDWPVIEPDRWLSEFGELPIRPESQQRILLDNARELFGI